MTDRRPWGYFDEVDARAEEAADAAWLAARREEQRERPHRDLDQVDELHDAGALPTWLEPWQAQRELGL